MARSKVISYNKSNITVIHQGHKSVFRTYNNNNAHTVNLEHGIYLYEKYKSKWQDINAIFRKILKLSLGETADIFK